MSPGAGFVGNELVLDEVKHGNCESCDWQNSIEKHSTPQTTKFKKLQMMFETSASRIWYTNDTHDPVPVRKEGGFAYVTTTC